MLCYTWNDRDPENDVHMIWTIYYYWLYMVFTEIIWPDHMIKNPANMLSFRELYVDHKKSFSTHILSKLEEYGDQIAFVSIF